MSLIKPKRKESVTDRILLLSAETPQLPGETLTADKRNQSVSVLNRDSFDGRSDDLRDEDDAGRDNLALTTVGERHQNAKNSAHSQPTESDSIEELFSIDDM